MKKTILIIACLLLPLSLMAMKSISESELSNITCQSGVSIMIDVTMDIHFDIIAWGDPDGYGNTQSSPQVGNAAGSFTGASESMV
ncbi:MAG TPA: hypothetical protein PLA18_11115, partial [Deltaproteobacteria bacterium]|nr:hypothetical protein [Deltaproteobacteria bacterium]